MKVTVVYVYPVLQDQKYFNYATRFLHSYQTHPALADHESVVVLNGGKPTTELRCMFSILPNLRFLEHDDSGYDIGAYQKASSQCDSDLIVFFNTSVFINNHGWLLRMVNAYVRHGDAQYGCMGNRGDIPIKVWPHIRTTAFWMPPALFNSYPERITRNEQRHPFEHGPNCLTSWLSRKGYRSWVITMAGDYAQINWDDDPNGYQRGNQSSLLCGDRMCERPYFRNDNRCVRHTREYCEPWATNNCWDCLVK